MAIQIGKYKRPGIFLEEYDNSIIATPIVEGITNLVIGVSRKGPVNTPVRITTISDLESVFGTLDRGLERKGSYFHRTAAKMLESSPIFAMNLLVTDDTLDTLEYKSISASSNLTNDMERLGAYRRFHDTTGFWRRDTDSFISLTKSNLGNSDRVINLTNLSDRYATVFIFNSQVTGFDRTLIEWYGSAEKVPTYLNSNDWASDYMVDVVIIAGDWSDYRTLAVDPRWSAYFNANGLRREQVRNFAQDRNVTTLAFYEGLSLIPYFRDANGRNVFIETTINRDTDKTGIFCAFNNDLVEEDFYNGKIDIIGHTIAGTNKESIEFLSYQEDIMEEVTFTTTPLDLPGNVTTLVGASYSEYGGDMKYGIGGGIHTFADTNNNPRTSGLQRSFERTTYYAEEFARNLWLSSTASTVSGATGGSFSTKYKVGSHGGYAMISDKKIDLTAGTYELVVNGTDFATSSVTKNYSAAFVLDSSGILKPVVSTTEYKTEKDLPVVESTDIVLSYATFSVYQQTVGTIGQQNVVIGYADSGANNFKYNFLVPTTDYTVTSVSDGVIKVSFTTTNNSADTAKYAQYRRFKMFNRLVNLLSSANISKMAIITNQETGTKVSMEGMTISDIVTSTTKDKSFVLNTGLTNAQLGHVITRSFLGLYTLDNELLLGTDSLTTKNTIGVVKDGVVAKHSELYSKFYGGQINTGDFFYNNRVNQTDWTNVVNAPVYDITFVPGETAATISLFNTGPTTDYAGNDYVVFNADPKFGLNEKFRVRGAGINTGIFTIISGALNATTFGATGKFVYQVNENTAYEVLTGINFIQEIGNNLHYLKMYVDGATMSVSFLDSTLTATASLVDWANGAGDNTLNTGVKSSTTFYVNSEDTNYKQTLEIEVPTGYTEQPNKVLVLASRYPEVLKGDFLEADYDETLLAVGEVPRKMTRILNKTQYAANTTYMEITCDAKIKKVYTGAAYQTTRYKKVDNYVETYKAISLKGFRIRQASMPDGTETRQNQILNIVAKGTPLFKALTNKEAIDFRYLVDTFGNGLTEKSKQQLVDICGERLDAFGFINMPSMKQFKNSSSPSFTNAEGVLQAEFIAKGADPASGPAFYYGFGEGSGSTTVGYFLPYVTINDNGRPMEFPPASYVAATYMRKHNAGQGAITPWTIAAGVTNGRITGINGLEIDFTPSDIEFLNGAQMNPLVFKRNRGHIIETENTAQTLFKSALSYIHVREVLIELERELSRMLLDFQWRFNTADTRSEIKLRADVICESYVSRVGLYNYFNKMDEENNTSEIIDNQIGVLDTYVEPIKGMGIIVNNVTILRTGAIAAGGFL